MRSVDALSRFGGEEFVILLRNVSILQAEEIAWRLRAEIACLTDLPGGLRVTARRWRRCEPFGRDIGADSETLRRGSVLLQARWERSGYRR
jgi:GGDEF domain-containing protein